MTDAPILFFKALPPGTHPEVKVRKDGVTQRYNVANAAPEPAGQGAQDPDLAALLKQYAGDAEVSPADLAEAVRQYREVERRYRGTVGWLKAPNGQPSNLNERQWVLTRTPNFLAWFGNWMYRPDKAVAVTRVRRDPGAPTGDGASDWRNYALHVLRGKRAKIADNGVTVEFFRSGLHAATKNRKRDARALFASLPDVLSNSVYLGYTNNTKPDAKPGVLGYEHYVAAVELDGKVREVSLTVDLVHGASRGRGYYYHQIGDVEIGDAVGSTPASKAATSPPHTVSLGDLPAFGNPLPSSRVVDANGEPLVVNHGTSTDIPRFDHSRTHDVGFHFGDRDAANYVTHPSRTETPGTAYNAIPAFLAIRNPISMADDNFSPFRLAGVLADQVDRGSVVGLDATGLQALQDQIDSLHRGVDVGAKAKQAVIDYLTGKGHDGLVYANRKEGRSESWTAFGPGQIKSAIGNAGTFRPDLGHLNKALPPAKPANPTDQHPAYRGSADQHPAYRDAIRKKLADLAVMQRQIAATDRAIHEAARDRLEVVQHEIDVVSRKAYGDDNAGQRYRDLLTERGRLHRLLS